MEDFNSIEIVARFLFSKRHFSTKTDRVRYGVFNPPENLRLSVYIINGITDADIWQIGDDYVAPLRGPILARADLESEAVKERALRIEPTKYPHPRHAEIVDWPSEKQKWLPIAKELADVSNLVLKD